MQMQARGGRGGCGGVSGEFQYELRSTHTWTIVSSGQDTDTEYGVLSECRSVVYRAEYLYRVCTLERNSYSGLHSERTLYVLQIGDHPEIHRGPGGCSKVQSRTIPDHPQVLSCLVFPIRRIRGVMGNLRVIFVPCLFPVSPSPQSTPPPRFHKSWMMSDDDDE